MTDDAMAAAVCRFTNFFETLWRSGGGHHTRRCNRCCCFPFYEFFGEDLGRGGGLGYYINDDTVATAVFQCMSIFPETLGRGEGGGGRDIM